MTYQLSIGTLVVLLTLWGAQPLLGQSSHPGSEVEITDSDIIIFCEGHKGGSIKAARDHGEQLFGSLDKFYENYYRIQCPPHFPSPLYMSVSMQVKSGEVDKEIAHISKLSKEKRHRILNRPSKGFFKQTVLDVVARGIKANEDAGNDAVVARYEDLKRILNEAGAKRASELTDEEKAAFN